MKLTSLQQHRLAKWWLLEELRILFLSSDQEMVVKYRLKKPDTNDVPTPELQSSLLEQLAASKHILLKKLDDDLYEVTWQFEFETLHRKQLELVKGIDWKNGAKLEFDDETGILTLGIKTAQIPPETKEDYLCRAMFKHRVGEAVDASTIYEEMTDDDKWDETARRMLKDAVRRVNKRANELLDIPELLVREKNTIRRTL